MAQETAGTEAEKLTSFKVFMTEAQIDKLEAEVSRRKKARENRDEDGRKIYINRSTIIREFVDTLP